MALAIGILVDEATVTIENVHVQMGHTPNVATAVLHASNATAVPRLLALLCILSVFIPAFIMEDPLRSLFMPLTLAVGFAMISSYLLSSTFVPILCVYLLKHKGHHAGHGEEKPGLFDRMLKVYGKAVAGSSACAGWWCRSISVACVLILGVLGLQVGTELFPQIDSGRIRAAVPAAARLELRADPGDGREVPRGDRARGEAREHRDHHGLRRPGRPELRHRQHGAVHARAGRRPAARRLQRGQRHQARRVPRAAPQGPPRAGAPLAGPTAGAGRIVQGRGEAASRSCPPSDSSRATSSPRS